MKSSVLLPFEYSFQLRVTDEAVFSVSYCAKQRLALTTNTTATTKLEEQLKLRVTIFIGYFKQT